MSDLERVSALEQKVKSLEQRMTKVESADDIKNETLSALKTKVEVLTEKLETFLIHYKDKEDRNRDGSQFKTSQLIAVFLGLMAIGGTVWGTTYSVKKTMESQKTEINLSTEDLNKITDSIRNGVLPTNGR